MIRRLQSVLAATLVAGASTASAATTFNRDVAPIVFEHCSGCHRPGEAGPFDLLDYPDVMKHGKQIVEVTRSGFMPPWLPSPDGPDLRGERRLAAAEIETFRRWYDEGMPEGDPADLPPPPRFTDGWQLGAPQRVLTLEQPYTLPADGIDVIRNFVIRNPVSRTRYVRALELRPGNKKIVHHAVLKADRTRWSRRLDAASPVPGFEGMRMGNAESPDGHVIVWTPGASPYVAGEGLSFRLEPDTDLVLQLHMVPAGKPETVEPRIGLYFANAPPERETFAVMLREDRIDIPAGVRDYAIEDAFTLPVGVELLGLYPHAHYLGKTMEIDAVLPGGERKQLLEIEDWDFNWQDMYRYVEPISLPPGTQLQMRYTYDNSADNVRNPNYPPRRVVAGNRSSDEMGNLVLQVVAQRNGQLTRLREAQWLKMLADDPDDPAAHYNLGVEYARQEDYARAAKHYEKVVAADPRDEAALYALASTYYRLGDIPRALDRFERVARLNPANADAQFVLGALLADRGELEAAAGWLRGAVSAYPGFARAHAKLGEVLARSGQAEEAERHFRKALEIDPELRAAQRGLQALPRP